MEHNQTEKKGLLVYDTMYGSTAEAAFWVRALIDEEQHLEVKQTAQVITTAPFDYIIIGSYTRFEKPAKATYAFVKTHLENLARKQVAYFLMCGDNDETQILCTPGGTPRLIGGRNYLWDILQLFPSIKPVAMGAFGGRQVYPTLSLLDKLQTKMVEKLAKEGAPLWLGREIWESLIPERVEVFANEVREKILGLKPLTDCARYRRYWNSLQPATRSDTGMQKFNAKPHTDSRSIKKLFHTRFRIESDLDSTAELLQEWGKQADVELVEQRKTFFNFYYHAVKRRKGKDLTIHVTASLPPEDPGNTHVAFRCYAKPDIRKGAETDIELAKTILRAEGGKAPQCRIVQLLNSVT